jgi:Holliday junction DNA helicase RuvB
MFSFLKKCIQIEPPKSVRERALETFSRIEGLDDIKEMLLRALESQERAHILVIGPPACAKSMFMLEIEKIMRSKVYFAEGSSTTKAGLQKFIGKNQHKEIIIIDEIDKMAMKDQECLLTMMERGELLAPR